VRDINWIKERFIAHRGNHDQNHQVPENSLLAFEKAVSNDYAIECDVNMLKDGTVVVFHDETLNRMCGIDRKINDVTKEELDSIYLLKTNQTIPTLEEVLKLVNGQVELLIEIKPHGDLYKLAANTYYTLKNYKGKFAIQSFHPGIIRWYKNHASEVLRGQIAEYFTNNKTLSRPKKFILKRMIFNKKNDVDFINYNVLNMPNKYLNKAKKKGIPIIGYTAKSIIEYNRVKSLYDNAVFEAFEPVKK